MHRNDEGFKSSIDVSDTLADQRNNYQGKEEDNLAETRWDGSGGKGQWNDGGNAIALRGWHFHDYARIGKERIAQGKKNFIQRPGRACDLFRLTALLSASGINGQTGRRAEGGFRGG
ncbi:hypothetical protein V1478_000272 [Vespula squamosa]|uniref:Uncharacterized protein n=1 Tax=Vespula squamosa TaxID=30214 RepID=A0ABD2C515_VESSQ